LLSYEVDAQVGGRLAQLGGPLIDATAKQLAGKFFQRFGEIVGASMAPAKETPPAASIASDKFPTSSSRDVPIAWILALVVAALVGFIVGDKL
jgi:hypothetical protein